MQAGDRDSQDGGGDHKNRLSLRQTVALAGWVASGAVVAHSYAQLWREHGNSPKALWEREDDKTHQFYEELFVDVPLPSPISVLDVGSGMGHLIEFLHQRGFTMNRYLGLDLLPSFVEHCQRTYPSTYEFRVGNLISEPVDQHQRFDLVVALGVLVTRVLAYEQYVAFCATKMLALSRNAVLFNIITDIDPTLGNFRGRHWIGQPTSLKRNRLIALLDQVIAGTGAHYRLRDVRIYPDSVDTFVYLYHPQTLEGAV